MFGKNLGLCFSRIHCLPTSSSLPLTLEDQQEEEEEQQHQQQEIIIKRFNSLYDVQYSTTEAEAGDTSSSSSSEASEPPDLSSVVASRRFFVSTPGSSNSILDSSSSSSSSSRFPPSISSVVVGGGVPVRKYSPDPFLDFRASMEEMVRARRALRDPTAENHPSEDEWEYLHQLLMCYLSLNPKRTHRFIIGAFTDLLLSSCPSTSQIFV